MLNHKIVDRSRREELRFHAYVTSPEFRNNTVCFLSGGTGEKDLGAWRFCSGAQQTIAEPAPDFPCDGCGRVDNYDVWTHDFSDQLANQCVMRAAEYQGIGT